MTKISLKRLEASIAELEAGKGVVPVLREELEALRARVAELEGRNKALGEAVAYQEQQNAALQAQAGKLAEALRPFSEEAVWWQENGYREDDGIVEPYDDYDGDMTCGDLFRARAALAEYQAHKEGS